MRTAFVVVSLLWTAQSIAGEVTVGDAWARATMPGQGSGAVYMTLASAKPGQLVGVKCAQSAHAAIHSMTHENNMMKMREMESLALPAGKQVELKPGGNHLMLTGLKKPLKAGEDLAVTLTVQFDGGRTEEIEVRAQIRSMTGEHGHHHDH